MLRFRHSLKTAQTLYSTTTTPTSRFLTSFSSRHFSLFGTVAPQQNQQAQTKVEPRQKTYNELIHSLEKTSKAILDKTSVGRALSYEIAEEVEPDKYLKKQRYEIFINKMEQLYRTEMRFKKKQSKKFKQMQQAHVFSQEPLKDILRFYNELSIRGFESSSIIGALENVSKSFHGRGLQGRSYNDYNSHELLQSNGMAKIVDDIKHGLRPDQYFIPLHMGQIAQLLGDIGYKNTSLIPLFLEKLSAMVTELYSGEKQMQEVTMEDAVFGGAINQVARHYVYQGFRNHDEFQQHMRTLLDWESAPNKSRKTEDELQGEAAEIQNTLQEVIDATKEMKEIQKDQQASIDALRQQFFKMQDASDKYAFLVDNPYIKYDLLELQEMLVNAGYIDHNEQAAQVLGESTDERMARAANVFYDYVLNYQPELISPQYDKMHFAAQMAMETKPKADLNERQTSLTLRSLSQTLFGVAKQALSYRVDVEGRDYLHKFYEDYLMPNTKGFEEVQMLERHLRQEYVLMQREYLKGWKEFSTRCEKFLPVIEDLVQQYPEDVVGQLYALQGLVAIRQQAPKVREAIYDNLFRYLKDNQAPLPQDAIVAGLLGLAQGGVKPKVNIIGYLKNLVQPEQLSFPLQIDVLWSLALLEEINSELARNLVNQINKLNFERIDNEICYDDYMKLIDIQNALKIEGEEGHTKFNNKNLEMSLHGEYPKNRYQATEAYYDPFKTRVVSGVTKGLSNASIHHQVLIENDMYHQQKGDQEFFNYESYPYKPDIVLGYKSSKVGLFVLPETQSFRDTNKQDGVLGFRMRLIEKASKEDIKTAAIAIPQVVSYDIEALHVSLNKQFNLQAELDKQIPGSHTIEFDFSQVSNFGSQLLAGATEYAQSLTQQKDLQRFDGFLKQMFKVFQIKQQVELRFDPIQKNLGYDHLRVELMKLSLMYDNLGSVQQSHLKKYIPDGTSFKAMLLKVKDSIRSQETKKIQDNKITQSWIGTRLEVELPVSSSEMVKKSIVPEIINQRFMWVDDYFHYDDWKTKLQQTYDNFNLLVIPRHKDQIKLFHDKGSNHRIVPQGVFPLPNVKRQILQPAVNTYAQHLIDNPGNDQMSLFEANPLKLMVVNELKKTETQEPITGEVSMIANLQNLKQGLKQDYSDKEILNIILVNLNFTDLLIEDHLGLKKTQPRSQAQPLTVQRDAVAFRDFMSSTYFSHDIEDAFSHFLLKEAARKERIFKVVQDEKDLELKDSVAENSEQLEKIQQRKEIFEDKVDRMLLAEELENEDMITLGTMLPQTKKLQYDLKSLIMSENINDIEPELQDATLGAEQYLQIKKRQTETKLIKTKIIYKLYQGHELSKNEALYLTKWKQDLLTNKDRNLLNLRDSMVPEKHSTALVEDMDAKNLYTLNSIPRVSLDTKSHGHYQINDIVLELSHFLDEEVVNKVEMEIYQTRIKDEWNLSDNFRLVETRNKEIGLVLQELEEFCWRQAGMIHDDEFEMIKKMVSIQRNMDLFDKEYYENDMKSMRAFIDTANQYDDRIKLVEQWLVRKEDEYKTRVNRPPAHLKKTDAEIHVDIDKPLKRAREQLVSKLLQEDEHGNKIEKKYNDLTSQELNRLTENLCIRLYMFNYDYPPFLNQAVKAIIEHPNIGKSDRDMLDTYCKIFELDYKGEKETHFNKEFLHSHPIPLDGSNVKAYGNLDQVGIKDMLKRACVPYVSQLANQVLNHQ